MARERWLEERISSGANQRLLRKLSGLLVIAVILYCKFDLVMMALSRDQ
jgi:hypothetical protein